MIASVVISSPWPRPGSGQHLLLFRCIFSHIEILIWFSVPAYFISWEFIKYWTERRKLRLAEIKSAIIFYNNHHHHHQWEERARLLRQLIFSREGSSLALCGPRLCVAFDGDAKIVDNFSICSPVFTITRLACSNVVQLRALSTIIISLTWSQGSVFVGREELYIIPNNTMRPWIPVIQHHTGLSL